MQPRVSSSYPAIARRLRHLARNGTRVSHVVIFLFLFLLVCFVVFAASAVLFEETLTRLWQVVAMEMRQCEYRAVIPSALACGASSSFLGSAFGLVVGAVTWAVTTAVYLLLMAAAALVVSAFTGYGSRFAHNLPEVQARMLCALSVLMFCFASRCFHCIQSFLERSSWALENKAMAFEWQHNARALHLSAP